MKRPLWMSCLFHFTGLYNAFNMFRCFDSGSYGLALLSLAMVALMARAVR